VPVHGAVMESVLRSYTHISKLASTSFFSHPGVTARWYTDSAGVYRRNFIL